MTTPNQPPRQVCGSWSRTAWLDDSDTPWEPPPTPTCDWCGQEGTPSEPLEDHIIAPPVDGYRADIVTVHSHCATAWARSMTQ